MAVGRALPPQQRAGTNGSCGARQRGCLRPCARVPVLMFCAWSRGGGRGTRRVCFYARRAITQRDEMMYDYGDQWAETCGLLIL